ncbi:MAG: chorismate transformation enzyme, FkbO/Hyg5 family, partial [Nitrospiraceae bacterium]
MSSAKPKSTTLSSSPPVITPAVSVPAKDHPAAHAVQITYVEPALVEELLRTSRHEPLALIRYDPARDIETPHGCPTIDLNLPLFQRPALAELWTSPFPVTYASVEDVRAAMTDRILFACTQIDDPPDSSFDGVICATYRHLLSRVRMLGYPHLIRMWNYFPGMNTLTPQGLDRYQHFCVGRYEAFAEMLPDLPRSLPAATAVGTKGGPGFIYLLAARQPGIQVHNPRQLNAYEYPSLYGPRNPSFARATLWGSEAGQQIFIAGTASIVGHASLHPGLPHEQAMEIVRNLKALLDHVQQLHGHPGNGAIGRSLYKVYVRHPLHFPIVRSILRQHLSPSVKVL